MNYGGRMPRIKISNKTCPDIDPAYDGCTIIIKTPQFFYQYAVDIIYCIFYSCATRWMNPENGSYFITYISWSYAVTGYITYNYLVYIIIYKKSIKKITWNIAGRQKCIINFKSVNLLKIRQQGCLDFPDLCYLMLHAGWIILCDGHFHQIVFYLLLSYDWF